MKWLFAFVVVVVLLFMEGEADPQVGERWILDNDTQRFSNNDTLVVTIVDIKGVFPEIVYYESAGVRMDFAMGPFKDIYDKMIEVDNGI